MTMSEDLLVASTIVVAVMEVTVVAETIVIEDHRDMMIERDAHTVVDVVKNMDRVVILTAMHLQDETKDEMIDTVVETSVTIAAVAVEGTLIPGILVAEDLMASGHLRGMLLTPMEVDLMIALIAKFLA